MTWALFVLALRRDRILLPVWFLGLALTVLFSVTATRDMYPEESSMASAAETINATAALVALYGKIYDPTSIGAISLIKMTAFGASLVAILFVFVVVRHSRAEEESGRLELVSAGAVKRSAPLAAALLLGLAGSVALGALTCLACGAAGLPWPGSVAFGAGWALSGFVFSAVAAVAAQVVTSARAAVGIGVACVGAAYVLRAVGDLAQGDPGWASWLSPIGWSQQIRPFAGDRWWVIAIPLVATSVLVVAAFALHSRRDLGSGLVPDRPGPATGRLRGVGGLAWRLQRGMFLAWLIGAALMGAVLGSIAHNVTGLLESAPMREFLALLGGEQALTDAFLAAEVGIFGAIVSAYGIAAIARLRSEEATGRAELLLSTATTRPGWAASHFVLAVLGVSVLLVVIGVAIGAGHGLAVGEPGHQVARLVPAAIGQIPAALVVAGLAMALFGIGPRLVSAAWGLLAAFIVLGEFGVLWRLPQWALDLSPFAHSPRLPGGLVDAGQVAGLLIVAAALSCVGFVVWRRRDVTG